jgi:acetyltransferase-like isoleucine patch superfamily enzyme
VESGATVGDYVTVKNGVMIWEGVTIEDGVFVGPGVIFTNDMNPRSSRFKSASGRYAGSWLETTLVMQGCSIGAGSVIVCGTELGRFSMIGAGSVVVKSVPAHALVYGNPARVRGYVCKCGTALNVGQGKGCCPLCNKRYIVDEKGVRLNEE